jgi:branched-chain amino acid transport system substrate-binding protein
MTERRRLLRAAAWLVLSSVPAAAGCGSPTGTAGTTPDQARPTLSGAGASPAAVVTDYQAYVGGSGGAAQPGRSPVVLGWVNFEGGAVSLPEATLAANAAVKYVNTELGGIGGSPLALRVCTVAGAEEEGQKCGQRLLSDKAVSTIAVGNLNAGDSALSATVAGQKPMIVGVGTGPALSTAKNTYILFGDLPRVFAAWGTYAHDALHAKTAALLYTNVPGDKGAADAVRQGLEAYGIKVKAVGFDAQAVDLLGPVTAAGATSADMIVPIAQGRGCVGIAKALDQIRNTKPVVATPVCLSPDVAQGLGGDLPHWVYGIAQTLPSDSAADAARYLAVATRYGLPEAEATKVFAALAWSTVLSFARLANAVGPDRLSPATMSAELQRFDGPVVMGAAKLVCGSYAAAPAVCNDRAKFYQYVGRNQFKVLTPWLQPHR